MMETAQTTIKDTARVWVFASNRRLSDAEVQKIETDAKEFCMTWTAHKVALTARAFILHNTFLVVSVDEDAHGASGCSIDTMHAFVRKAGTETGVNFFDRLRVVYPADASVENVSLAEFEKRFAAGKLTTDMLVFNPLVSNGKDLAQSFLIPLRESWLSSRI